MDFFFMKNHIHIKSHSNHSAKAFDSRKADSHTKQRDREKKKWSMKKKKSMGLSELFFFLDEVLPPPVFSTHSKMGSNVTVRKKVIQPFLGRGLDLKRVKSKKQKRKAHARAFLSTCENGSQNRHDKLFCYK
jgi:hypothetical protein